MTDGGVGPRTGSDPQHGAQEIAVLRAQMNGLRELVDERARAIDRALTLQAEEYERRLEQLNGERGRERDALQTFIPREVYEASQREVRTALSTNGDKVLQITGEVASIRTQLGSLQSSLVWITRVVVGAVLVTLIGLVFAALRAGVTAGGT